MQIKDKDLITCYSSFKFFSLVLIIVADHGKFCKFNFLLC